MRSGDDLGEITFSPGGEEWIEFGPAGARRRVGFHDYAALYAVPGLYERVFVDVLGMRTADEVVGRYQQALIELGRNPADERVLDLGAGDGIGGELLRALGVPYVVAVDVEPAARRASDRDRPEAYDDYFVTDLTTVPTETIDALRQPGFTTLLALSSIGVDHITAPGLARLINALLGPSGLVAFAVSDQLLPDFHDELFELVRLSAITTWSYVHRRQTDSSPHRATAMIARRR